MFLSILAIVLIFIIVPIFIINFISADASFAVLLILLYLVNPSFAAILGFLSGNNIKKLWWIPLLAAGMYLLSMLLILKVDETAFIFSGVALILGLFSMLLSHYIKYNRDRKG